MGKRGSIPHGPLCLFYQHAMPYRARFSRAQKECSATILNPHHQKSRAQQRNWKTWNIVFPFSTSRSSEEALIQSLHCPQMQLMLTTKCSIYVVKTLQELSVVIGTPWSPYGGARGLPCQSLTVWLPSLLSPQLRASTHLPDNATLRCCGSQRTLQRACKGVPMYPTRQHIGPGHWNDGSLGRHVSLNSLFPRRSLARTMRGGWRAQRAGWRGSRCARGRRRPS